MTGKAMCSFAAATATGKYDPFKIPDGHLEKGFGSRPAPYTRFGRQMGHGDWRASTAVNAR
jgi:hypothetical protein